MSYQSKQVRTWYKGGLTSSDKRPTRPTIFALSTKAPGSVINVASLEGEVPKPAVWGSRDLQCEQRAIHVRKGLGVLISWLTLSLFTSWTTPTPILPSSPLWKGHFSAPPGTVDSELCNLTVLLFSNNYRLERWSGLSNTQSGSISPLCYSWKHTTTWAEDIYQNRTQAVLAIYTLNITLI